MRKNTLLIMVPVVVFVVHGKGFPQGSTVSVNSGSVVHKGGDGVSVSFPDVCKTPSPGGPVPIPYPNIGKASDTAKGSKKVKMDGNPVVLKDSEFTRSTGDEKGTTEEGITQYQPVEGYFKQMLKGRKVGPISHQPYNPPAQVQQLQGHQGPTPASPLKFQPAQPGQQNGPAVPMQNEIDMRLVDEMKRPVPVEKYRVIHIEGTAKKGALDPAGKTYESGIGPQKVPIPFPHDGGKVLDKSD